MYVCKRIVVKSEKVVFFVRKEYVIAYLTIQNKMDIKMPNGREMYQNLLSQILPKYT
jgi:hypothetical protein